MENEELKWMANCIRRFCEEQMYCDDCPFGDNESGRCGICGVPGGWEGYEEKTEFAISTVAKKETVQKQIELVEE